MWVAQTAAQMAAPRADSSAAYLVDSKAVMMADRWVLSWAVKTAAQTAVSRAGRMAGPRVARTVAQWVVLSAACSAACSADTLAHTTVAHWAGKMAANWAGE